MNLPGGYECVCRFGYVYDSQRRTCVRSKEMEEMLAGEKEEPNVTETKSIIDRIVKTIARSPSDRHLTNDAILFVAMVLGFCY